MDLKSLILHLMFFGVFLPLCKFTYTKLFNSFVFLIISWKIHGGGGREALYWWSVCFASSYCCVWRHRLPMRLPQASPRNHPTSTPTPIPTQPNRTTTLSNTTKSLEAYSEGYTYPSTPAPPTLTHTTRSYTITQCLPLLKRVEAHPLMLRVRHQQWI